MMVMMTAFTKSVRVCVALLGARKINNHNLASLQNLVHKINNKIQLARAKIIQHGHYYSVKVSHGNEKFDGL